MIKGWIDLRSLQDTALPSAGFDPKSASDAQRVEVPGVEIAVDGRDTGFACDATSIVACEGRPNFVDAEIERVAREEGVEVAWLRLMREHGERGLGMVRGAFAMVFVDLISPRVILAGDRFAIRPLCYSFANGRISFASRADAVWAAGEPQIDPQALFEYLYFQVIPTPATVFRGVHRLRPAQVVVATPAGVNVHSHWTPKFVPDRGRRLADLENEFLDIVRAAVVREADTRRTACFLSGGTDSSTLTGMLAQALGDAPDAYSIGFDAQGYDEMAFARIAAKHFGARHHEYYITPSDLIESIPKVARHFDQPFGNSSALPAYYCARQAAGDGFERMLAGDGGDELFGGNSRYAKQRVFAIYHEIPEALRRRLVEPLALGMDLWSRLPLIKKAVSYVRQARLPMPERMETYNLLDRLGIEQMLAPRFIECIDAQLPRRQQREVYAETSADLVNSMLAYDWKYTLADNDLPKVCGTAEMAGIGVGFPLLSDELTDFSLRLPPSLKVRGLTLRYFFKRALREFLPAEILRKSKHGFGLPFGPWLLSDRALFRLAAESLAGTVERGLVRREFVDALLGARVREVPGYYGGMVWILMMLEQWLQQHAPNYRLG
ncbi:MAG: asparagine synthetase B family protein [Burkholderiales bacterium]